MKNIFYLFSFFLFISCKNKEEKTSKVEEQIVVSVETGKQLFETSNCTACHQIAEKVVGPSLQNIAKIYQSKKGNLVSFLKAEANPIVDPSQYQSMKINLEITKTMSDNELKALEIYILNFSKP